MQGSLLGLYNPRNTAFPRSCPRTGLSTGVQRTSMTNLPAPTRCLELETMQLSAILTLFQKHQHTLETPLRGQSMGRTIPDGTRIRIQCTTSPTYTCGQIVAFTMENRVVVHRVVWCRHATRRGGQYLITQGDGMALPDPPVPVEAVLGTVTAMQAGAAWITPPAPPVPAWPRWIVRHMAQMALVGALFFHVRCALWLARQLRTALPRVHTVSRRLWPFR